MALVAQAKPAGAGVSQCNRCPSEHGGQAACSSLPNTMPACHSRTAAYLTPGHRLRAWCRSSDRGLRAAAKQAQGHVFLSIPGTLQLSCTYMDIPGSAPSAAGTSGSGGPSTATWHHRHAHLLGAHFRIRIKLRIGACTFSQSESSPHDSASRSASEHFAIPRSRQSPQVVPHAGLAATTAVSYSHIISGVTGGSSLPGLDLAQARTNHFDWAHPNPQPGCRPQDVGNGKVRIVSS